MAEAKEYVWKQKERTFPWMIQQAKPPLEKADRPIPVMENYARAVTGNHPKWMPAYGWESNTIWPDVVEEHPVPEVDGLDYWGVYWVMVEIAGGMITKPGTRTFSSIENWRKEVKWPDTELFDKIDWKYDGEKIASRLDPERAHIYECVEGIFERLHEMIPFVDTLLAFVEEPEETKAFFERMADYKINCCQRIFDNYGRVDGVLYHDDWGNAKSGFFSNEMFRDFLFEPTKRLMDFIKGQGKFIELHSCGKNIQYVPMMIDMGIDMWTPQENLNPPDELFEKYNDRMSFAFAVNGLDKPEMTENDVRKVVRDFVDKYGKYGRVLASLRTPFNAPERAVWARDELLNYSLEYYDKKW
ncbi:MAG: methyltransferase [Eubacteriaceae bacterium]|nr:methyltransferase [Eubacteriaceae bacterium]